MKQTMMVAAMDLGYKQLPFGGYAKEVSPVDPYDSLLIDDSSA